MNNLDIPFNKSEIYFNSGLIHSIKWLLEEMNHYLRGLLTLKILVEYDILQYTLFFWQVHKVNTSIFSKV